MRSSVPLIPTELKNLNKMVLIGLFNIIVSAYNQWYVLSDKTLYWDWIYFYFFY